MVMHFGIAIIAVLAGGANMPKPKALPKLIASVAFINAISLKKSQFTLEKIAYCHLSFRNPARCVPSCEKPRQAMASNRLRNTLWRVSVLCDGIVRS